MPEPPEVSVIFPITLDTWQWLGPLQSWDNKSKTENQDKKKVVDYEIYYLVFCVMWETRGSILESSINFICDFVNHLLCCHISNLLLLIIKYKSIYLVIYLRKSIVITRQGRYCNKLAYIITGFINSWYLNVVWHTYFHCHCIAFLMKLYYICKRILMVL